MSTKRFLRAKRATDVVVSLVALVLLSPVFVFVAVVLFFAQGRPILFSQVRAGLNSKPFMLHKFRTMKRLPAKLTSASNSDEITNIGRLLRRSSVDELPQLWNVLRGEMSLIGPRPLLMEYLPRYNSRQSKRHAVRPGLAGLAQARGRNLLTWEQRLELDVAYVESVSLATDLRVFFSSLHAVFRASGITPAGSEIMEKFEGASGRTEP